MIPDRSLDHTTARALGLAALLGFAGVAHLRRPRTFDRIVPAVLPGPARAYTLCSGVVELALATGLAVPRTRSATGALTAAFFVAVFPANVQMAVDDLASPRYGRARKVAVVARLPLQWPLVATAWRVHRPRG